VAFEVPAREAALTWLRDKPGNPADVLDYAGGAPLAAAALAADGFVEERQRLLRDLGALATGKDDPVSCAQRWKTLDAEKAIDWLYRHIAGLIQQQTRGSGDAQTFNIAFIDLMRFLDNLSITRRQLGTGLDEGLLLENCLIRWCELASAGTK
jgi:DNA polymerase-3 subunit delta'